MKFNNGDQLKLENLEPASYCTIILNKEKFIQFLNEITFLNNLNPIKNKILTLKYIITHPKNDNE